MKKNVPIQAYLPPHLAAWLETEARRANVSRSHWIGTTLMDLFQGQDFREDTHAVTTGIQCELAFLVCAIDELLNTHPHAGLRQRVHDAFRKRIEREQPEAGV